jgi:hypothetical protein
VWYSTRGCATANLSAEETREWIEHLRQFRGARLALLEACQQQLATPRERRYELRITAAQVPDLMAALNDHRLWLAARHDIGQAEMDARAEAQFAALAPERQAALMEIDLLAYFIEVLLRAAAPDAARWMEN